MKLKILHLFDVNGGVSVVCSSPEVHNEILRLPGVVNLVKHDQGVEASLCRVLIRPATLIVIFEPVGDVRFLHNNEVVGEQG